MKTDYILCSVSEDLIDIDKANLRMNGIMITDDLNEALQPMLENESNCLLITDKVIEEQSSLPDITKVIETLYEIYPKQIRIIYVKIGGDHDSLIKLMDANSNWDVYYNQEITSVLTEDLVDKFMDRKIPMKSNRKELNKSIRSVMVNRANMLVKELNLALKENKDAENNNAFKSILFKNMNLVRDLVIAYDGLKEDLVLNQKEKLKLNTEIEKLSEDLKDERYKSKSLESTIDNLETNRRAMHSSLRTLQSTHNTLVDKLGEVVNVGEVHTSLSKYVDADKYITKAPLIVYFKEQTKMNYFTTFLTNLNTLITNTVGLSRVIVVENDLHTNLIPLYTEKDYVYVTDGTEMSRVVLGNLVTCGNNLKLMNYLIQNSLKLDILFVYDRTGSPNDLIEGHNVIKFNLLKNLKDKETLRVTGKNIITNDSKGDYYLGKIKEYDNIRGNEDLELSIISSLEITKKLITYINDWNKVIVQEDEEQIIVFE